METRIYIEYRNRINSTINNEQLSRIEKELHNLTRDQDKVDLYSQIEKKRALFGTLQDNTTKGIISAHTQRPF